MAKNDAYWADREAIEKQWMMQNLKDDKVYAQHLNGYYDKALNAIQDRINDQYTKYAGREGMTMADAKGAVSAADQTRFAKEAADVVKESRKIFAKNGKVSYSDFSDEVNSHMRLYNATMRINRLEYLKAQIGMEAVKANVHVATDMAGKLTDDYLKEVKRQAGILGDYVPPKEFVDYKRAFGLVMNSGNPRGFSDTLWKNGDAMKGALDMALTSGLVQGLNPRSLTGSLREHLKATVKNAQYAADRLARTESARVQSLAQDDCYKDLGVKEVRWIAEPSACKLCADLAANNEGIYKLDDVPTLPAHPNCRCSKAPHADRAELDKLIAKANAEKEPTEVAAPVKIVQKAAPKPTAPKPMPQKLEKPVPATYDKPSSKFLASHKAYVEGLAPEQQAAIRKYTSSEYDIINPRLRKGKWLGNYKDTVADLDKAIAGKQLGENVKLYRGLYTIPKPWLGAIPEEIRETVRVKLHEFGRDHYLPDEEVERLNKVTGKYIKGQEIADKAFLSTSYNADVPEEFGDSILMKLNAKSSAHGIAVEGVSMHSGEQEILFGTKTKVTFTNFKVDGYSGKIIVEGEVE